jgi:hypothetical protein
LHHSQGGMKFATQISPLLNDLYLFLSCCWHHSIIRVLCDVELIQETKLVFVRKIVTLVSSCSCQILLRLNFLMRFEKCCHLDKEKHGDLRANF